MVLRAEFAFGLPGPGTNVTVAASSGEDSAVDTVTLDLYGASDSFNLEGLKEGDYTLEAVANGGKEQLLGTATINLSKGENKVKDLLID